MATATRARRNTAPKEEAEEPEGAAVRQPTRMHELFAEYLNANYDAGVTPLQCAIFTSKRSEFRRSDAYQNYRTEGPDEADSEEAKPARRPRAAKKAEEDGSEETAKATTRRRRGAAAKEAPAEEEDKPAAKPATRRRRSAGTTGEDAAPAAKPATRRRRSTAPAESEDEPF